MKQIKASIIFLARSFIFLCCLSVQASEQLDAHEHGSASLDIAVDNNVIAISFESPAVNIVGFEYSPGNEDQKLLISNAKTRLSQFEALFQLEGDVPCEIMQSSVEWLTDHDEHEEHDEGIESEHAEFLMGFELQCSQLENLESIDVRIFESFPAIEEIDARVIFSGGQLKQELTPLNTKIQLHN